MVQATRRWRLPLLVTLLVAAALELVVHRVMLQVLKPQILQPESEVFRLFNNGLGPLSFFFTSFLALSICAWLLMQLLREEGLFPLPWRVAIGLFSCVFMPICAVGAFVSPVGLGAPSPALVELHPYLDFCFAPMIVAIAVGGILRRGPILPRVGVILGLVPLLAFAYFSYRAAVALGDTPAGAPIYEQLQQASVVPQWGRLILLGGGVWVYLFFYPLTGLVESGPPPQSAGAADLLALRRYAASLFEVGPLLTAVGVTLAVAVAVKVEYSAARTVADAAFAYDLPSPSGGALLTLASLFLFVLTVAGLAWRSGPTRTTALGLLILGLASFRLAQPLHDLQLAEPLYYLLAVVGLLAVLVGVAGAADVWEERTLAANSPTLPDGAWRRFLDALGDALDSGPDDAVRLVRVTEGEVELSGLHGKWRGLEVALRFRRRQGRLQSVSFHVGEALDQRADWEVTLAADPQGDAQEGAGRERLEIRDRAQLSDRLLRGDMSDQLRQLVRGEVQVWLHVGVRYRAQVGTGADLTSVVPVEQLTAGGDEAPPVDRLLALGELLHRLARRAGLQPG